MPNSELDPARQIADLELDVAHNKRWLAFTERRLVLAKGINEYRTKPHTPELVTQTWQTIWKVWGETVGSSISVPEISVDPQQIEDHEKKGDLPFYVPPDVTLSMLAKIFPMMHFGGGGRHIEGIPINSDQVGFRFGDASDPTPNLDTRVSYLRKLFAKQGRNGMDLREYMILSRFAKLLRGKNLDEELSSRLLESAIIANFWGDGSLTILGGQLPRDHNSSWGARSSEAVRKSNF